MTIIFILANIILKKSYDLASPVNGVINSSILSFLY